MDHAIPSFDVRDAEEASYFPGLATSGLSSSSYVPAPTRPTRAAPTQGAPSNTIAHGSGNGGSMLSKLFLSEPILIESKKPFASESEDQHNQVNSNQQINKVFTDNEDRYTPPLHPPSTNNRRASIAHPAAISAPAQAAIAPEKHIRSGEATPSELAETEFDILRREREVSLISYCIEWMLLSHSLDSFIVLLQQEFLSLLCENLSQARLPDQYMEEIERDLADTLNQTVRK